MNWDKKIYSKIESCINNPKNKIAVFDADGTIWPGDIGESFFEYQIKQKSAPGLKNVQDPMIQYRQMEKTNPFKAYSWLAEINTGLPLAQIEEQALDFGKTKFLATIPNTVVDILRLLEKSSFQITVCSASVIWPLRAVIDKLLGIKINLIAFNLKISADGILTPHLVEPLPYKQGKKDALIHGGIKEPDLVFGNSMGDFEMLQMAKSTPIVIRFEPQRQPVKESEDLLKIEAEKKSWPIQVFKHDQ